MQLIVKEDKLQRYRAHVMTGQELNGKDKVMFDRYFFAFSQLLDGQSERQTVVHLMNLPEPLGGVGQSQAYNIINGAHEIFGALDFGNAKKVAKRYIYATRLEEMAARLEELSNQVMENYSGPSKLTDDDDHEDSFKLEINTAAAEKEAGILLEKSANILMKAAKIRGLLEKDKIENPNKYKVAPNLIFTDDLDSLELARQIEDTEFEDVTGD